MFDFDSDNFDSQSFENSDSNAITTISATRQDTSINALQLAAIWAHWVICTRIWPQNLNV